MQMGIQKSQIESQGMDSEKEFSRRESALGRQKEGDCSTEAFEGHREEPAAASSPVFSVRTQSS